MTLREDSGELDAVLLRILKGGGVAIIPCDTIYGIVGVAPGTEDRIRRIKGRGEDKPFLQLLADASWVGRFSAVPLPPALAARWPGPLTMIVPLSAGGTVGVRVPATPFLSRLLAALDVPVYSTSVNRAGRTALWKIAEIRSEFEGDVDVVVDGGDLPGGVPSTIVDVTARPFRVLRQGALAIPDEELR